LTNLRATIVAEELKARREDNYEIAIASAFEMNEKPSTQDTNRGPPARRIRLTSKKITHVCILVSLALAGSINAEAAGPKRD
jgi:hypothetical protein